ncbi:DUF3822 family protein [Halosquirtibacter laminarini]|uniref:DUF3822 family protein n=1 Tax=Halosquirtibacter laminarini TaxID=3374600 RepID=A0AC61NLJ4_9BACT|nr:DUF3822 family protein [Prolixibacteraceae bacterium]
MESTVYIDKTVSNEVFYKYERSIQVSLDGFSFSITDSSGKTPRVLAFGFESLVATPRHLISVALSTWLKTLPFLQEDFRRTSIVFDLGNVVSIPVGLFSSEDVYAYCKLHFPSFNAEEDRCIWNQSHGLTWGVLFTVPCTILEEIQATFKEVHFLHLHTLMHQIGCSMPQTRDCVAWISVKRAFMSLFLKNGNGDLLLANHYCLDGEMDMSYYLLCASEQCDVSFENLRVVLMGDVSFDNESVRLLQAECKYIDFFNGEVLCDLDTEDLSRNVSMYMPFLNVYKCELLVDNLEESS